MKKKIFFIVLFLLLSFVVFKGVVYFYSEIFYFRLASYIGIYGMDVLANPIVSWSIVLSSFILIMSNLFFFLIRYFPRKFLVFDYILYFILLLFALFFKSSNSSAYGISINPVGFIIEFMDMPFEVLVNFLLFIPLGILFGCFIFSRKKVFFISIILLFTIELIQLIFKIGFFDVSDIVLNMIGIFSGYEFITFLFENKYFKKIAIVYVLE